MLNMDFIPDDYVQNTESRRTNLMYLILLLVVMLAIGGAFFIIKLRQRSLSIKERITDARIAKAKDAINKFEQLQEKRKTMTTGALTAIELLEPVPRSVLLAAITNNLPRGASLLRLDLIQKKTQRLDQVQLHACTGTQAHDVARIGRNLRGDQDQVQGGALHRIDTSKSGLLDCFNS